MARSAGGRVAQALVWAQAGLDSDTDLAGGSNAFTVKSLKKQGLFQSMTIDALFEDKPQSANDTWRKLHSDPLLLIRQREQEALARIKNNPIKMAMIKKSVEDEKKKKQDKKEKKRHKDHHHSRSKDDKRSLRRYSESGTDLFACLEFDQAFVSRVDFIRQRFHPCPFTTVLNRFFVLDLNPRMMDAFHLFFFRFFSDL
ncbi:hypothetical protein C4D60_Mb09t00010 [Musa balbisiana]|uniref:Uncharacterized protein n=1 Tax=Musa balbisiana TaxID=52838 RepID=A0A4S8ID03_MUSBA|nr:hypothetical protein C4D60_Mb09t00010 [Musa balbisiana]